MSRYRKFTTMCCAAVFALGLAACGGGGNSGPNTSQEQMLQEQVATLQGQINALRAQLGLAADDNLGDSIESLQMEVARLQKEIQDAKDEVDAAARKAMIATAAKLYAGIGAMPLLTTGDGARSAAYSGTNDADITVTMDDAAVGDGTDVTQALKATDMSVAANHGWEGKQYAASGRNVAGTYEAVVYSNVGSPTQGDKFGQIGVTTAATGYEYGLDANGMLIITTTNNTGARVRGASFDQTSGVKQFKLPSPNPSGVTKVSVSGSFHGVSGTYTCTPGDANTCAASKTARGFTLGLIPDNGAYASSDTAWTFRPSNPEARVTDAADTHYASYGWWIHTAENGDLTASAFVDNKDDGTAANVPAATGVTALEGTATYMGGAAGKYALASSTGGTNDAGHFTARATLEADFGNQTNLGTITGTIDQFMGADGKSRAWSVKLNESALTDGGGITGALGDDGTTVTAGDQSTVWTIDGTAAKASGMWSGDLKDTATTATDVSGVPKIATGIFYTEYGTAGRMVGAFGANKQ